MCFPATAAVCYGDKVKEHGADLDLNEGTSSGLNNEQKNKKINIHCLTQQVDSKETRQIYSILFSVEVLIQVTHIHVSVSAYTSCTLHIVSGV